MGVIKQIYIKNRTYYLYNDITDYENFKSNLSQTKNHIKTLIFTVLDIS